MLDHPVGATGEHDTITDRIFRRQVKCVQYASLAEQARRFYLRNEDRNRSIRDCQKRPSGEWSGLVRRVGSWGFRSLFLKKNRARSQPPTQLRRVHSSWLIYIFRGIVKESHASENENA
jgi:hypothetical protein